jgi:ABC-type proline/glycine betaine transport system permease subunit
MYVSSVCSEDAYCKCFHLDDAKVDLNVAYTYIFQMLQVFHASVASVSSRYYIMFEMVSSVFRCFCKCFRHMFQVFHLFLLYVITVASECFKSRSGVAHRMRVGID